MRRGGTIIWIVFLLAALFAGPTVILKTTRRPTTLKPLRLAVEADKFVDAPRPLTAEELEKTETK